MLAMLLLAVPCRSMAREPRGTSCHGVLQIQVTQVAPAESAQGDSWLRKLTEYLRSLGNYTVRFSVKSNGQSIDGVYTVAGSNYYLQLADAEVYCNAQTRYEVDNNRREVTIDRTNLDSHNILDNPTRAFDFVGSEFLPQLTRLEGDRAIVTLLPQASQSISAITLTLDARTAAPQSIEYDFDGERICLVIQNVAHASIAPKTYNATSYDGYEFIDFR